MRTLYYNGNVITMNEAQPKAEAILVENGRIVAVGSSEALLEQRATAHLMDLDGATVLPGFIDSHSHFAASYEFPRFDPSPVGKTDSVKDLIEQAKAYLEENPVKEGEWFSFPSGSVPSVLLSHGQSPSPHRLPPPPSVPESKHSTAA